MSSCRPATDELVVRRSALLIATLGIASAALAGACDDDTSVTPVTPAAAGTCVPPPRPTGATIALTTAFGGQIVRVADRDGRDPRESVLRARAEGHRARPRVRRCTRDDGARSLVADHCRRRGRPSRRRARPQVRGERVRLSRLHRAAGRAHSRRRLPVRDRALPLQRRRSDARPGLREAPPRRRPALTRITTAATLPSVPTGCSTSRSATAGRAATRRAMGRTRTSCSGRSCGSILRAATPTRFRPRIRSPRAADARRSSPTACATPGSSASTPRAASSGRVTSARARTRRSTASSSAATTAGTLAKASIASRTPRARARDSSTRSSSTIARRASRSPAATSIEARVSPRCSASTSTVTSAPVASGPSTRPVPIRSRRCSSPRRS